MKEIKIKKISTNEIIKNKEIYSLFDHKYFKELKFKVRTLSCDFYMDTNNYYPITKDEYYTFPEWFDFQQTSSIFYTKEFEKNFIEKKLKCKVINDAYVIGSSPGNNYYRNIYTFLYRLLFIKDKKVNIAIHRNTSNDLRDFIKYILKISQIKLNKIIYLDEGFYLFKNCKIPSFLNLESTIKFYNYIFPPKNNNKNFLYISRRNAKWRKIINEGDFYPDFEKNGFEIIDFENLPVIEQIRKMQTCKKIIAPHGSGLVNLIFAAPKTSIIEILQKNISKDLMDVYLKYKKITFYKKINHHLFEADLVDNNLKDYLDVRNLSEAQHIGRKMLVNSQYFKNFIVKESDFKKLISNFAKK